MTHRRLISTFIILIAVLFLASACKGGAAGDPKRKEAVEGVKKFYADAAKMMVDEKECVKKADKAKDFLKDKIKSGDIPKLVKDFADFPTDADKSELKTALKPGKDAVDKCVAELKKDEKKNEKDLKEIKEDLAKLDQRVDDLKDAAKKIADEEAAEKAAADKAAADKAAADKAAADKAAADKAAADKAAADKAAADKAAADKAAADAAAAGTSGATPPPAPDGTTPPPAPTPPPP